MAYKQVYIGFLGAKKSAIEILEHETNLLSFMEGTKEGLEKQSFTDNR
ncbi:MAG: hypothetical protein GY702_01055 [Desulfobulbaceae bacterium]|nr:hypothetical protein [Desulfobulbaceae bacterium]